MKHTAPIKPVLVFACGNPSRGDDALGPILLQRLELALEHQPNANQIEFLTDFQFQIEHAMDLHDRELVVFVDASLSAEAPFEFEQIFAAKDVSYTTHAMNPEAVLDVYQQIYQELSPPSYLLSIRGTSFELGDSLSISAEQDLKKALQFIQQFLT